MASSDENLGKPQVLCLEDNVDTIQGTLDRFKAEGVQISRCDDLGDVGVVAAMAFDLILVDLRIPHDGVELLDGGVQFARSLRSGVFGTLNQRTACCILTAFPDDDRLRKLDSLLPSVPVIGKGGSVAIGLSTVYARELPWLLHVVETPRAPNIVRDLLRLRPTTPDSVSVYSGAWPVAEEATIPTEGLPNFVRQELDYGNGDVWVWASINIRAASGLELQPHDFVIDSYERDLEDQIDKFQGQVP